MNKDALRTEWCLQQNQFDSYEKHSLYIKLTSIILFAAVLMSNTVNIFIALFLAVLWLQDGIWKTFQARIEHRLLLLEKAILEGSEVVAFQYNTAFTNARLNGLPLIIEYVCQSIRPTVAFPHLVLICSVLIQCLL